jgi:hypothetical protein
VERPLLRVWRGNAAPLAADVNVLSLTGHALSQRVWQPSEGANGFLKIRLQGVTEHDALPCKECESTHTRMPQDGRGLIRGGVPSVECLEGERRAAGCRCGCTLPRWACPQPAGLATLGNRQWSSEATPAITQVRTRAREKLHLKALFIPFSLSLSLYPFFIFLFFLVFFIFYFFIFYPFFPFLFLFIPFSLSLSLFLFISFSSSLSLHPFL